MTTETLPDTLAVMAQSGDRWAVSELLRFHQRMIRQISNRFTSVAQSMTMEDLQQEVVVGMLEVLRSWKSGAGNSFATHCFTYLPHKIRRQMDSVDGIVHISARRGRKLRQVYRETGEQTQVYGVSLYKPGIPGEDYDEVLLDEVEATASQENHERRQLLRQCAGFIDQLPPRESSIFTRVMLGDETVTAVAQSMGVSKQYVSATYKRALGRVKKMTDLK